MRRRSISLVTLGVAAALWLPSTAKVDGQAQQRPRTLAPDAEESIDVLRGRANAPKVPAALNKAGVTLAFSATGLREPRDFVRNAAHAVREGLNAEAALSALTLDAAKIAGADTRVGSVEKGKIANLLVTTVTCSKTARR